jgi:hypothetical protein
VITAIRSAEEINKFFVIPRSCRSMVGISRCRSDFDRPIYRVT